MGENKVNIISEQYENEKTGEKLEGITIMIDGQLKKMFDIIFEKEGSYTDYREVMRDILFSGINSFIEKYKQQQ